MEADFHSAATAHELPGELHALGTHPITGGTFEERYGARDAPPQNTRDLRSAALGAR